jgi:AcrR family transcriptional regulator
MPRRRKRTYDPAGLRGRTLDAAAAAFQAHGYHSTSTHEIMREAGITGGALHHHFPTKKSLGLAVIQERVAVAVEETWIDPVRQASSALEGILDVFEKIAASLDEQSKVLGCPANNLAMELSLADPEFQDALGQLFQNWKGAIAEKARSDKPSSAVEMDSDELGTFVVALYSGAIAMAKAQQSPEPLRTCARQLASLLKSPRQERGPQAGRRRLRA